MRKRSEPEIKAYIDGYNASFKQFKSCLDMGLIKNRKAADKMQIFVDVVNGIIEAEGDEESKSEKEIIFEETDGAVAELEAIKRELLRNLCKGCSCCPFDIGSCCGIQAMINSHIDKLKGEEE